MPEIPYSEVHYHNEYKQLAAIVGKSKLGQEHWDEWARLQAKYGWRILLKAADRVEPLNRWPANTEAMCIELKKAEDEAQVKQEPRRVRYSKEECEQRAARFQAIRDRVMNANQEGERP